jgi:hypothetical protein
MSNLIVILVCSGLLVYWVLLLHGSEEAIDQVLECDLWRGRRFLLGLRSGFVPQQQLAG